MRGGQRGLATAGRRRPHRGVAPQTGSCFAGSSGMVEAWVGRRTEVGLLCRGVPGRATTGGF